MWRETLQCFLRSFGDREARLFRSPGRINLRGMHVDTHGGFLNLMTHQRETIVVAGVSREPITTAINTNPRFPEISFSLREFSQIPSFRASWEEFISAPEVRERVTRNADSWGNYVEGCALNVQHRLRDCMVPDLCLAVGSNLPHGAALSSSAALCTSLVLAFSDWADRTISSKELILAARDGEWYTGSRCGLSDQAAIVLGTTGKCVNIALHPSRLDVSSARTYNIPEEDNILVVDSKTQRSISGKQLIDYTRNRFAYSIALHVFRQELAALGVNADEVAAVDSLSALSPSIWKNQDGLSLIYRILLRIPETIRLNELQERYAIPEL
ncbi:MAG: galactokinase family protein, partial [Candidatus Hydrogenedentes bacterium]|nr:galactokinase family protein [Candidatus Hydrogenedentota bacterium]